MAGTLASVGSDAAAGATIGSIIPGLGTVAGGIIGAGIGLAPSVFKFFSGNSQKNAANQINPYNPGYQINNQVVDNGRILGDRYNNYSLPGQTNAQNKINNTYQNAFVQGSQGASSGQDVADLAAKLAYGKQNSQNQLQAQQEQGKDAALGGYLNANAAAGQQFQNKNQYDIAKYYQDLARKDSLNSAGNTNEYNALDNGSSVLSSLFLPKTAINYGGNTTNPQTQQSIFTSGGNTGNSSVSPTDQPVNYNAQYRYAS